MEIIIDGLRVNYESEGSGPDLLMLHGWDSSLEAFNILKPSLSTRFRVICFDFPGFGKSDMIPRPWSVSDYADFTLKLIDVLGLKNPVLVVHSFGGRVAIKLAGQGMISPSKMVFLDAAGIRHKPSARSKMRQTAFKLIKRTLTLKPLEKPCAKLLEDAKKHFGSADYNNAPPVLRSTLVMCVNEDLRDFLPAISCPTLLIFGEKDTATPVGDAKIMEEMIPDAGLCVIKGAGHFSFIDRPGEVIAILNSFFGG